MSDEIPAPADALADAVEELADADCGGQVSVIDLGNPKYAHLNIRNNSANAATVEIQRIWIYQGRRRTDNRTVTVPANEKTEVFSFPRNQSPQVAILSCSLA